MRLPVVPGELISSVLAAGTAESGGSLGEQLVLTVLGAWDVAEIRDMFLGLLRSAATSKPALVMLREFVTEAIVGPAVGGRADGRPGSRPGSGPRWWPARWWGWGWRGSCSAWNRWPRRVRPSWPRR